MHNTAGKLRPIDGVLIFGISYVVSTIVTVSLSEFVSVRLGAAIASVVLLGVAALLLKVAVGSYFRYVRVRMVRPAVLFYSAVASLAIILPTLSLQSVIARHFSMPPELIDALITMLKAGSFSELVYVWIVAAVGAALSEEFIFRGVLQNCLAESTKGWVAVVVTSLVFGVLHTIWRLPPAFILGILLGVIYLRTGSILPSILAHIVINSVSIAAVHLSEILGDGAMPVWVMEDESAPVYIVGGSLAIFVLAMWLLWRATRTESPVTPLEGPFETTATGQPGFTEAP